MVAIVYNPDPNIDDFDYDKKSLVTISDIQAVGKLSLEKEMELDKDLKMYQKHVQLADSLYKAKAWSKALNRPNQPLS